MEINQAIEQWLELCPCDNFTVKNQEFAFGKAFNRTKTITLYFTKTSKENVS